MEFSADDRGNIQTRAVGNAAVKAQADIITAHIKSRTLIKLTLYVLSAFFATISSILIVFGPTDKETSTNLVSLALLIVAAGSAGYSRFSIKVPAISSHFEIDDKSQIVLRKHPNRPGSEF